MIAKIEIKEVKTPFGIHGDFEASLKIQAEDYEKKPMDVNESINIQAQISRLTMLTQMLRETMEKFYDTVNEFGLNGESPLIHFGNE